MASRPGRDLVLTVSASAIAGVRMLGIKFDSEFIDVTNSDSDGIRTLLSTNAGVSCTITVSGVQDGNTLRTIAINPATSRLIEDVTFTDPGAPAPGDVITGDFFLTSFETTGEYKDAVMFNATFESSGAWVAS